MTADEAIELGGDILDTIQNDISDSAYSKATEFFDSVSEKVREVIATIETSGNVTTSQVRALENWESAVNKWVR